MPPRWFARTPEPELMDDPDEVASYEEADFGGVERDLARRAVEVAGARGRAVDLGTGPASIPVELCRHASGWRVLAIDAGPRMLEAARRRVEAAGLQRRIRLRRADVGQLKPGGGGFDLVLSNSLLHHLRDPLGFWRVVFELLRPGGAAVVQDLYRPVSEARAGELTRRHTAGAPALLRKLFHQSLLAAYTPAEVGEQLALAGIRGWRVSTPTDRHLLVIGRRAR